MADRRNDLVDALLERAARYVSPHELTRLEIEMRQQFGGKEHYIRRTVPGTLHLPKRKDAR